MSKKMGKSASPQYVCPLCSRPSPISEWAAKQIDGGIADIRVERGTPEQAPGAAEGRLGRKQLRRELRAIGDEYTRRRREKDRGVKFSRFDAPNAYVRREIYALTQRYRDAQKLKAIRRLVEEARAQAHGLGTRNTESKLRLKSRAYDASKYLGQLPNIAQDPFRWMLAAVLPLHAPTDLRRWAEKMVWADGLSIPPSQLEGAAYQVGKVAISKATVARAK